MNIRLSLTLLFSVIITTIIIGQSTSSPYSLFAEGQIENIGSGTNHALGGTGIALRSRYALNPVNPASCTAIDSLSFLFETGLYGKYTNYISKDENQSRYDANLRYMAFGCRFTRWWQTSVGFMPFSSVGYTINATDYVQGELSAYTKTYQGSGGINQFYWAHSFKLIKNLGLGMNISYYLGSISQTETGSSGGENLYIIARTSYINTVQLDYGAQYTFNFKDMCLTLGAVYGEKKQLSSDNTMTIEFDDVSTELDASEYTYWLPRKYGAGVAFEKGYKFRVGVDYERKEWSGISTFKYPHLKTRDGERFSAGIEYTPYKGFRDEGWKKLSFRLGGNYNKSYLIIDGIPMNSYSLVTGVGIPLRKELTMINISLEGVKSGSTKNGLFREDYLLLHINFTVHDRWFMRHSYD